MEELDEGCMVGHDWLRNPKCMPNSFSFCIRFKKSVLETMTSLKPFVSGIAYSMPLEHVGS